MAFTLLHTADLHLGKSFSTLPPERAEQRRADLLATLTRICRKARAWRVDLLCVAGDLFDRVQPAMPLLAAVRAALSEAEVPVLLLPGNHDPLEATSPYLDAHWPGNVMRAGQPGWQRMPVDEYEVWAFGYARGEAHRSPWEHFPGCGAEALLALHAACLAPGLEADAGYYPFTPRDIPACAYLALGHHHRALQVARNPVAWYAGSPEPLEPEMTPAAVLRVKISGGAAEVEPLDLATRHHRLAMLEVTGLAAGEIWDRALSQASADDLLLLKLTGMLAPDESLDLSALRAELSARCFAVEVNADEMTLPTDLDAAEGARAALYRMARQQMDALPPAHPQRRRLEQAVRYAALALEGRL